MIRLVLDSGAVSRLSERSPRSAALVRALLDEGLWPAVVPSAVLVECLTGLGTRDAGVHRLLRTCEVDETITVERASRAALLRHRARHGSAVDALVVATAEPGGAVLTGDLGDIDALATYATDVTVRAV